MLYNPCSLCSDVKKLGIYHSLGINPYNLRNIHIKIVLKTECVRGKFMLALSEQPGFPINVLTTTGLYWFLTLKIRILTVRLILTLLLSDSPAFCWYLFQIWGHPSVLNSSKYPQTVPLNKSSLDTVSL